MGDDLELNGTPIVRFEASMNSRSVFERIASFQPRARASASDEVVSANARQPGSEPASAPRSSGGAHEALVMGHALERKREHVPVRHVRALGLDARLACVVAGEQSVRVGVRESRASSPRMPPFQSISVP